MEKFKDKYNLTREQNIFLVKKEFTETIYNATKLEGCNTTFIQTEKILKGINDGAVPLDEVQIILNLKSAWGYILNNLDKKLDINFICEVNKRVSKNESLDWGVIRYGDTGVRLYNGERYTPPLPDIDEVIKELEKINKIEGVTDRAIHYYLWGMRSQLFWDGNKRISNIVANSILIKEGKGLITIPEAKIDEFNKRLSDFYITNDYSKIDKFIYDECLKGITINRELEKKNKRILKKSQEEELEL